MIHFSPAIWVFPGQCIVYRIGSIGRGCVMTFILTWHQVLFVWLGSLCAHGGIPWATRTTLYHPESDGLVECCNMTLLMMLPMFAGENRDDWDDLLPAVMMSYHSSVHESTGFSSYRLMFGEECTLSMDVGLPRQEPDLPDPITSQYAVWVCDALEWHMIMSGDSMIRELSDGCYGVCQ